PTTPQRLSVYGTLLLQGAMAAARGGDGATVRDLLHGAEDAAKRVGEDENHYWTCFGPTNVKLHRAAAAVELGDAALAVEIHDALDPVAFAALLPERRANHYLDVARGYAQLGKLDKAGEMLVEANRLAPSEIRCRPLAHEVVTDLLRRARGAPPSTVAELAEQMGVTI
ncbi:MAG: transcriptional regulator, partial [Dactylosporangium sp.]|nr:transcriptional regulator [Dactylosporangium sp.]